MSRNTLLTAFNVLSAIILLIIITTKKTHTNHPLFHPEVLFPGHKNNHIDNSRPFAGIMTRKYFKSGIYIAIAPKTDELDKKNLKDYAGSTAHANHHIGRASQEESLLDSYQIMKENRIRVTA